MCLMLPTDYPSFTTTFPDLASHLRSPLSQLGNPTCDIDHELGCFPAHESRVLRQAGKRQQQS